MIPITALCGSPYRPRATVTISSNTANYTLSTSAVSGYVAGVTDVTLVISSAVWVYSLNPALPALTIDSSFAAGDSITIVNQGYIFGGGGRGAGFTFTGGLYVPTAGQDGGSAISTSRNIILYNASYIGGGGGGGGGVQRGSTYPYGIECGGGGAGGGNGGGSAETNGADSPSTNGTNGATISFTGIAVSYSGGGGGLQVFGTSTSGPFLNITVTGQSSGTGGTGAGGGGTGAVGGYNQASGSTYGYGGNGGGVGGSGGNGNPINYTGTGYIAGGGGGGGWGGAGGAGAYYAWGGTPIALLTPGAAGNAITLNGNTITYLANNTIWGAVS